jgi:CRP-like cAMP-binding protein
MTRVRPTNSPYENGLLAHLPAEERKQLVSRMDTIRIGPKDILYQAGGPMNHVYFPIGGVISSAIILSDGRTAEVTATGNEGMVGLLAAHGGVRSTEQVFCQLPGEARRMDRNEFIDAMHRNTHVTALIRRYTRTHLRVLAQHAACNSLHTVEQRCAKWLLLTRDRVGTDEFPITQEFLSAMLGVRRATVTRAAGALQKAGDISYRHGRLRVLDPARLTAAACECYRSIREALADS